MAKTIPIINQRYHDIASGRTFEVLLIDEYSATIELHFDDGDFDQINFDDWSRMAAIPVNSLSELGSDAPKDAQKSNLWSVSGIRDSRYMFAWDEF